MSDVLAKTTPSEQSAGAAQANEPEDEGFTRRGFVKVAVGGVGLAYAAAIGYPIYRYLNSPVEKSVEMAAVKEVTLPNADKLPQGSALMFKFGVRPSLLIHHTDNAWTALTAVCTHMGCTVAYNPATARIECHCHGGVYDAKTGDNISGPPPRPLTKYNIKIAAGSVTVTRA
jgi:cytochrome b6-f complex iron-sulfur subunit